MSVKLSEVTQYIVDNVNKDIPDWELTFDNQDHVLRGSELIEIVKKSINEIYKDHPMIDYRDILLEFSGKIIRKIGQLAD